jgi:catechol 2,3-dioxygenase-like lactoylglutathione lyase family enzyme
MGMSSPPILLDHITLTVPDLVAAQVFYDAALTPLSVERVVEYVDPEDEDEAGVEAVGYAGPDEHVVLWLVVGAHATRGLHLSFRASDTQAVKAFFDAAVHAGGKRYQSPRPWQIYRPGAFAAMVSDPYGNIIEASTRQ